MRFEIKNVRYIPAQLQPGILYVSKKYGIAVHLCACGCATKIRTPLGPTEWLVKGTKKRPTLNPSVGSWQEACRSHYWIRDGEVRWADKWTPEQITAGRHDEERRRAAYYDARRTTRTGIVQRLWQRAKNVFRK
jgi:hypothetical protein